MLKPLDPVEARALGSLVEKSLATPDQYPLTFQALLNACNQKTSREPLMSLGPPELGRGVESLIDKELAERVSAPGARVPRFRHRVETLLPLAGEKEIGVLCVMLLRGPQTPGELKTRTERLCRFQDTAEVESLLQELCARPEPWVARLPRRPGQKENRYQHLFSGPVPAAAGEEFAARSPAPSAQPEAAPADDRLTSLERRVAAVEAALSALQAKGH